MATNCVSDADCPAGEYCVDGVSTPLPEGQMFIDNSKVYIAASGGRIEWTLNTSNNTQMTSNFNDYYTAPHTTPSTTWTTWHDKEKPQESHIKSVKHYLNLMTEDELKKVLDLTIAEIKARQKLKEAYKAEEKEDSKEVRPAIRAW